MPFLWAWWTFERAHLSGLPCQVAGTVVRLLRWFCDLLVSATMPGSHSNWKSQRRLFPWFIPLPESQEFQSPVQILLVYPPTPLFFGVFKVHLMGSGSLVTLWHPPPSPLLFWVPAVTSAAAPNSWERPATSPGTLWRLCWNSSISPAKFHIWEIVQDREAGVLQFMELQG